MNYKLTIDINLMDVEKKNPAMETLKRWKTEGKVELIEADPPKTEKPAAYGWPGSPPKPANDPRDFRVGTRGRVKKDVKGGVAFKDLAAILFPNKDSQKLNMGEINDVAHMVRHHATKNELFVTEKIKDFLEDGKRERLKASFGIVALTPAEAVKFMSKAEGWK